MNDPRPRPILFDCDPGHDDAIALMLAFSPLAKDQFNIRAVTVVGGNQVLEKTHHNARKILTVLGVRDLAPIAPGAAKPLVRPLMVAPNVHGETGLDGPTFPPEERLIQPSGRRALDLQIEVLEQSDAPVTILAVGPLTNLGILISSRPDLLTKIDHITIMGGALLGGNWSAAAEFNIMVDPEAANIVFGCGRPVVMCGLDVTHQAYILEQDIAHFRTIGNAASSLTADLLDFFKLYHQAGVVGVPLHDPVAVAYELMPQLFTTVDCLLEVETDSEFCNGTIICDRLGYHIPGGPIGPDPQQRKPLIHKAVIGIHREGFLQLLEDAMRAYGQTGGAQ